MAALEKSSACQMQARAQKQLQQLRADRKRPQGLDNAASNISVNAKHSTNGNAATVQADALSHWERPVAETLPTKAELRGTLGTVNRKVHAHTLSLLQAYSCTMSVPCPDASLVYG